MNHHESLAALFINANVFKHVCAFHSAYISRPKSNRNLSIHLIDSSTQQNKKMMRLLKRQRRNSETDTTSSKVACRINDFKMPPTPLQRYVPANVTYRRLNGRSLQNSPFGCAICNNIDDKMYSISCAKNHSYDYEDACRHSYCGRCQPSTINKLFGFAVKRYQCVLCDAVGDKLEIQDHPRVKMVRDAVLIVRCPYNGCDKYDTITRIRKHLPKCEQASFKCPFDGCDEHGTEKYIQLHAPLCSRRTDKCTHSDHCMCVPTLSLKHVKAEPSCAIEQPKFRYTTRTERGMLVAYRTMSNGYVPTEGYNLPSFDEGQVVPPVWMGDLTSVTCSVCFGVPRTPVIMRSACNCSHVLCSGCASGIVKASECPAYDETEASCPLCRAKPFTRTTILEFGRWPSILRWQWMQLRVRCSGISSRPCSVEGNPHEVMGHEVAIHGNVPVAEGPMPAGGIRGGEAAPEVESADSSASFGLGADDNGVGDLDMLSQEPPPST